MEVCKQKRVLGQRARNIPKASLLISRACVVQPSRSVHIKAEQGCVHALWVGLGLQPFTGASFFLVMGMGPNDRFKVRVRAKGQTMTLGEARQARYVPSRRIPEVATIRGAVGPENDLTHDCIK
jgi:hypothetical protein